MTIEFNNCTLFQKFIKKKFADAGMMENIPN